MFLRVSDTPQSYPRLCMYLKLILCSPSPASERLSHLPSAYAQREQLIIYHGGWRFFTTHTNTASKFLTVVQAFRPFRTSDTKLRQKKNQLTKISDVTFQIHATFFLRILCTTLRKRRHKCYVRPTNPHISHHIPDCDVIWYECPY